MADVSCRRVEHPTRLPDGGQWIGQVVEHVQDGDGVERTVDERQPGSVAAHDGARVVPQQRRGDVQPDQPRAGRA